MFSRHPGDDRMTKNEELRCRFCGDNDIGLSLRNGDAICKRCSFLLKECVKTMVIKVSLA
jgi:hypothetical protein